MLKSSTNTLSPKYLLDPSVPSKRAKFSSTQSGWHKTSFRIYLVDLKETFVLALKRPHIAYKLAKETDSL